MELEKYKENNGHCNCPTKSNGSLGEWINRQRGLFRSKKIKADRYEKLVGIGFAFEDMRFANENEKWNTHFVELVKYKQTNGHCTVPRRNGSLGRWITLQRELFRSKEIKADRYEKLVGIGFVFEAVKWGKFDEQWQDMYQKLLEHHKVMKGRCFDVPRTLPLGRWLKNQRWFYSNGKLREDRAEKLLSVGFDDKKVFKKGGAVGVRDAPSGQPSRKNRKVEDLDNDLATMTYDEGKEGIDDINANDDVNDNGNAREEIVEEHTVAATELVVKGIKERHSPEGVAPPLEENNEGHKDGPAVSGGMGGGIPSQMAMGYSNISFLKDIHENDVLCGKGGAHSHSGNRSYRKLIKKFKDKYLKAKKKEKKMLPLK
eukprot:scaffold6641_cov270-Chaetoceros_neogracile.AAC.8